MPLATIPDPILLVCAGNLCRSPFAAAYLRWQLETSGLPSTCFSRGLIALPGQAAPPTACEAAADFGIDLGGHISQPLLAPDLERAELVLVMEHRQRRHLSRLQPMQIGKIFLLSHPLNQQDIPDPVGQDKEAFRQTYALIARCVDAWMQRFQPLAGSSVDTA